MFYKKIIIKIADTTYIINLAHRLSEDLTVGVVSGMYLVTRILKRLDTLSISAKSISIEIVDIDDNDSIFIFFKDDEIPEFIKSYIVDVQEIIDPNRIKFKDTKLINWILPDVYSRKYILFNFETSDFIRGVITVFDAFNIDIKSFMYLLPFTKVENWEDISFTVKNSSKDLLVNEHNKADVPYLPKTRYSKYCRGDQRKKLAVGMGINTRFRDIDTSPSVDK